MARRPRDDQPEALSNLEIVQRMLAGRILGADEQVTPPCPMCWPEHFEAYVFANGAKARRVICADCRSRG